jgi:hypothetical protein
MTANAIELLGRSKVIILELLKKVEGMSGDIRMTSQSTVYRKRAAALGRAADLQEDHEALLDLVKEALSWIQLAENEEALAFEAQDQ